MENTLYADDRYQPISEVYDGKSIFVTGGSGFLGKVFVEKILYRCPKVAKIYILMRDTEKASADEKLKKMLDCPLFKRLKEERPQDLEKIIPIKGDICKPKLGINTIDENILTESVSMVFHFAASVKFNDPLHVILDVNVDGIRRVLDLCLKIKNLKVFVYVSTAFSNGNRKVVDEVMYPPVIPLGDIDVLKRRRSFTNEEMERILSGMPNIYTVSKNLAENVVAELHKKHGLPTVIVRPSIFISCKDEPVSGWIDNWFGPTALVVAIRNGVIKAVCCDGDNVIDLIPVDYVSNVVIVAGARCRGVENLEVYNSCSSAANPITLRQLTDIINDGHDNQNTSYIPLPKIMYIKWRWLMTIVIFFLETVPAYFADCISRIFGKKVIHLKMLSRVDVVRQALDPFTSRTWMMKSPNTSALADSLSANDRRVFACDAESIDWNKFIPIYLQGVQQYLLNNRK